MKDWYGDAQLRLWSEINRGQWEDPEENVDTTDDEEEETEEENGED